MCEGVGEKCEKRRKSPSLAASAAPPRRSASATDLKTPAPSPPSGESHNPRPVRKQYRNLIIPISLRPNPERPHELLRLPHKLPRLPRRGESVSVKLRSSCIALPPSPSISPLAFSKPATLS